MQTCKECGKKTYTLWLTDIGGICFDCMYPNAETEEERNKRMDKEIEEEWKHLKK